MSRSAKLNVALLLAVGVVFALNWGLETDAERPNYEVLPGMVRAVPYESFSANPVLAEGITMQRPPAGTIPRQRMPLRFTASTEDAERAGRELASPLAGGDQDAVERGEAVYGVYCQLCHGPGGVGDGVVAQRGFPTPPSLLAPNARGMADGRLFHIATFGQGNMPGHAAQIEPEDRWKAVLWVRRLQADSPVEPGPPIDDGSEPEVAQEDAGELEEGEG